VGQNLLSHFTHLLHSPIPCHSLSAPPPPLPPVFLSFPVLSCMFITPKFLFAWISPHPHPYINGWFKIFDYPLQFLLYYLIYTLREKDPAETLHAFPRCQFIANQSTPKLACMAIQNHWPVSVYLLESNKPHVLSSTFASHTNCIWQWIFPAQEMTWYL
jgi:hypothetical protein